MAKVLEFKWADMKQIFGMYHSEILRARLETR